MVAERNPEINNAVDTLFRLSADEKIRSEYTARLIAKLDRNSQLDEAYEKGMAKGQQEILKLLKGGKTPEEIMKIYSH